MQTKPIRIAVEAEAAALAYGKSVSQGILEMNRRLNASGQNEVTGKVTPFQTGATYGTAPAAPIPELPLDYWKTFDTHVENTIMKIQRGY